MTIEQSIQEFYDQNPFPGNYELASLEQATNNKYIGLIDKYLDHGQQVLDIGCGTGFITNALALKYRSEFTGIDFSNGADIAGNIANDYGIQNVKFIKQNFFNFVPAKKYDFIIAQSFLTHVPDWTQAIEKIKLLSAHNGIIITSIYNTFGKVVQKILRTNYHSQRLQLDQESNPYDTTFSHAKFLRNWSGYELLNVYPSVSKKYVDITNLFNTMNGGLTMYVFRNTSNAIS
jgi:2-polyprenyl-3-methyl-5-hydroxy-6-metoxy-1,4-benzoquinol methylase